MTGKKTEFCKTHRCMRDPQESINQVLNISQINVQVCSHSCVTHPMCKAQVLGDAVFLFQFWPWKTPNTESSIQQL